MTAREAKSTLQREEWTCRPGKGSDALTTIVEAMQNAGQALPKSVEDDDGGRDYDPADYNDPRSVVIPVELRGASVRVNITMDDGLLARVDELSRRIGGSRSALLARGARLILAAEGDAE